MSMLRFLLPALFAATTTQAAMASDGDALFTRRQLRIVGSSTVYPFVAAAAEQSGRTSIFRTPIVEATGTGGGVKLFCEGVGEAFVDVVNASRPLKSTERETCAKHGIKDPLEIPLGFDGIVLANGKGNPSFHLTTSQIFQALAEKLPGKDGTLIDNPHQRWREIDPALPDEPIEVYGPPPTSGTRDAFGEIAMEKGCKLFPTFVKAIPDEKKRAEQCKLLREDGRYIDAGENDNIIVQKLGSNPHALGIFGYSFLAENVGKVQASPIDGVTPAFESIANGRYPLSRSLYVYVKREHLAKVLGFKSFLRTLTDEQATGEDGYMAVKGLIPEPLKQREANRAAVEALK